MMSPFTFSPASQNSIGGFPQQSSFGPASFGNAQGIPQLGLGSGFFPSANGNFASPPIDGTVFSPEASLPEGDQMNGFLSALNQAYAPQVAGLSPQDPALLQQQLAQLQQQMQLAQQSGDDQGLAALAPQLEALLAQLLQLMGGQSATDFAGRDSGASSVSGGGASPVGGGGGGGGGASAGGGGGGGVSSGGGGGGSVGPSASGGGSSASETSASSAPSEISKVPPKLAGDDKELSQFIETQLKGTPLEGHGLGAHFVKAGRDKDIDPLALVAISRHETNFGELGVGIEKHMGVGAFDSSPNAPRQWDGAVNQIYSGATTFNNLREKGGSNAKAPLDEQLAAVNKGGWATDQSWHTKVGSHYNEIAEEAARVSKPDSPAKPPKPEKVEKPEKAPRTTVTV